MFLGILFLSYLFWFKTLESKKNSARRKIPFFPCVKVVPDKNAKPIQSCCPTSGLLNQITVKHSLKPNKSPVMETYWLWQAYLGLFMNKKYFLTSKMTNMTIFSSFGVLTDRHQPSDKQFSILALLGVKQPLKGTYVRSDSSIWQNGGIFNF